MTNRQWLALMIGGTVLCICLILGGCALMGATLRMWGLA